MKVAAWVLGLVALGLLGGCTTVGFYSPDVGPLWSKSVVKHDWLQGSSLLGVTLKQTGESYTTGKKVGGLFDGGYLSDRTVTWDVSGPDGYRAKVVLVQRGIRYTGTASGGELKVQSSDWAQVTYQFTLTDADGPLATEPALWKSGRDFSETWGQVSLAPVYLGRVDDQVKDFRSSGLVTGYRLGEGDQTLGYLDLAQASLLQRDGASPLATRVVVLALLGFEGHGFSPNPTTLAIQGLTIDLNGGGQIKLSN